MSTAPRYEPRYTFADYCQWQGDWELWNGTAVAMSPSPLGPDGRYANRSGEITADGRWTVELPNGCRIAFDRTTTFA